MASTNTAWLMAAIMKVSADGPSRPQPKLIRPSELPIYHSDKEETRGAAPEESGVRAVLMPPVRAVRQQVEQVLHHTDSWRTTVVDTYTEVEDRTAWIVKYLREEENKDQRYGAVALGGLTGFILGSRGRIIKKLFYASIGTGVMGAVCFPEESESISKEAMACGRHYMNVAYNFCYGVKPGDPQLEVKLPQLSFPKDFSEFVDLTVKIASTVKQAIMPPPSKDDQAPTKADSKP